MQINFTGHHVDLTNPLKEFTTEKLEKLTRHFERIISIDVTFEVEKLRQIAKASVHVAGKVFHADASSEDMYQAVDGLVDKLDRQLKDHREKQTSH
ncbi:MAG: ribosomal subunit interface protein [Legionellales bacterium]|nr:ribosomal subunit interface protein [Legionellales bacterium]